MGKHGEDKERRREKSAHRGDRTGSRQRKRAAAPSGAPLVVNGWTLLFWTAFRDRWVAMRDAARQARDTDPIAYGHAPEVKFFRTVRDLIFREIPRDPDQPQFRQGKTLGGMHTHWRRAKFHGRFRLFFRFHTGSRTIIYAWLNDEDTLRKAGGRTDPYVVFRGMLERGTPPSDWDVLLKACERVATEATEGDTPAVST